MSFDLIVSLPHRPSNLRQELEREFAAIGFDVEIYPRFDPATWAGGFLPFRVTKAPFEYIGVEPHEPTVSGFEMDFETDSAHLRTAMGRTTTEFALQCFGAAILAKLSGGQYFDGQNELVCEALEAFEAARSEIKRFLAAADPREFVSYPFPGWDQLGRGL